MNRPIRIAALSAGIAAFLSCGCLFGSTATAEQPRRSQPRTTTPTSATARPAEPSAGDAQLTAKLIEYGERDVVRIQTKVRYSTLIALPSDEVILDFVVGDKDLWVIEGNQNLAYVKPAKEGSQTNLNLITASGNVYSFVLTEVSPSAGLEPDLKVYLELKDASMQEAASGLRRFVAARELEEVRQQAQTAREETQQLKESTQAAIDAGISQFVTNVRFAYSFAAGKQPFNVRTMYYDDKGFTYIHARPEETPTLYEIKDGRPDLINFQYRNGVYVVDKILDSGYLVIGKKKLRFTREE